MNQGYYCANCQVQYTCYQHLQNHQCQGSGTQISASHFGVAAEEVLTLLNIMRSELSAQYRSLLSEINRLAPEKATGSNEPQ